MPASSGTRCYRRATKSISLAFAWAAAAIAACSGQSLAAGLPPVRASAENRVPACVSPPRLMAYLARRNSHAATRYRNLADLYAEHGRSLGVRWDIPFLQMMVETANLTFRRPDGTPADVAPADNNFAGLGAIGDGQPGEHFRTPSDGVRAHLEHVLHYAGDTIVAPVAERTRKVQQWRVLADWHAGFNRPITFTDLARRWASHTDAYLHSIEQLARTYQAEFCDAQPLLMIEASLKTPRLDTAWRRIEQSTTDQAALPTPPAPSNPRLAYLPAFLTTVPAPKPDFEGSRKSLGATSIAAVIPAPPLPSIVQSRPITRAMPVPKAAPTPQSADVAPPPAASRQRLSADDHIRQLVSDRKVLLRTHGATIPLVFHSGGRVRGDANGMGFYLGAARDSGRWWAANGKLCHKWRIWLDRETNCLRLKEQRGTIYWRADDGKTGTARIVSR